MDSDKERYELCYRCLEESGLRKPAMLLNLIQYRIEQKERWRNPTQRFYKSDSARRPERFELCCNCPYALEHMVIIEDVIYEHRC